MKLYSHPVSPNARKARLPKHLGTERSTVFLRQTVDFRKHGDCFIAASGRGENPFDQFVKLGRTEAARLPCHRG